MAALLPQPVSKTGRTVAALRRHYRLYRRHDARQKGFGQDARRDFFQLDAAHYAERRCSFDCPSALSDVGIMRQPIKQPVKVTAPILLDGDLTPH